MRKLEKDNGLEMLESVIFLQKIDKQLLLVCYWYIMVFEYLTVSLDKISNKKIISKMMKLFSFI